MFLTHRTLSIAVVIAAIAAWGISCRKLSASRTAFVTSSDGSRRLALAGSDLVSEPIPIPVVGFYDDHLRPLLYLLDFQLNGPRLRRGWDDLYRHRNCVAVGVATNLVANPVNWVALRYGFPQYSIGCLGCSAAAAAWWPKLNSSRRREIWNAAATVARLQSV